MCSLSLGVITSRPPVQTEVGYICKYLTHVNKYIYNYLHIYISESILLVRIDVFNVNPVPYGSFYLSTLLIWNHLVQQWETQWPRPVYSNSFSICPKNTGRWLLWLQHLLQDNSQTTVLTLPLKFAMMCLSFIIFSLL